MLPDHGVYMPVRACLPCIGKEPSEVWGDVVVKVGTRVCLFRLLYSRHTCNSVCMYLSVSCEVYSFIGPFFVVVVVERPSPPHLNLSMFNLLPSHIMQTSHKIELMALISDVLKDKRALSVEFLPEIDCSVGRIDQAQVVSFSERSLHRCLVSFSLCICESFIAHIVPFCFPFYVRLLFSRK